MLRLRDPYRRWLIRLPLFFGWFGILPLLLIAGYYAAAKQSDFNPALALLRDGAAAPKTLLWAIRIGGTSCYRADIGFRSTHVGFNVDDPEARRRDSEVWGGALNGTYRGTYLAMFRGSALPTVITAFRDVTPDRRVTYRVQINGLNPVRTYFSYAIMFSCLGVIFLEIVAFARRRKGPAAGNSGSRPEVHLAR